MRHNRHRQHANPFNIRGPIEVPHWGEVFGREAPIAVDVGCGGGDFTLALARQHPEWNVVGLEIRQHFVSGLIEKAGKLQISNLWALLANANLHLHDLFENESVIFVSLNFPDPWYKKRHHKRRVMQTSWLDILAKKMLPGGTLHLMTDFLPIAESSLEILRVHPEFSPLEADDFLSQSSTGIFSEREQTHLRRGDPVYRLHYTHP